MRNKPYHPVLLSHDDKIRWFDQRINERQGVQPLETEDETKDFLRTLREFFKLIFMRDVPGYFIRRIAQKHGLPATMSVRTELKRVWSFRLMDENQHYRDNKTDFVRALVKQFGEKTLNYIVDDIWQEWHDRKSHPEPVLDIDSSGQEGLF